MNHQGNPWTTFCFHFESHIFFIFTLNLLIHKQQVRVLRETLRYKNMLGKKL